jgi:hypothetical protein
MWLGGSQVAAARLADFLSESIGGGVLGQLLQLGRALQDVDQGRSTH